ncbi:MAG: DNA topoisomerase IV subunit B [Bacteroidota bacterium]|nr:DNA topoisomerase IV subunit B [Bacteroidota bacterium]MDE2834527.1 DNA topoisomerase IV subunit B [Bacteroidota bacterium]MDE2957228.1 DNA topoisomerase IV subunit B [Bacteroidota bacterium]
MTRDYTGRDIEVLEGLDPVRKHPGMYIGGTGKTGLHHLLWEIVDNAVDEAANGFATRIDVVLHEKATGVTVTDNGRGIPVDEHPEKKIPTLEVILTTLHAGGKFNRNQYVTSGGLHGVGASVVNALSRRMVATVKRDGTTYQQEYARGEPQTGLKDLKTRTPGTGTSIYFEPDPDIFGSVRFNAARIRDQLEIKTYINRGLRIVFNNQVNHEVSDFHHEGGIEEYLQTLIRRASSKSVHPGVFTILQDAMVDGCRIEIALQWTEAVKENLNSYVNGIPTRSGGTHEQGLKDAVREAVSAYLNTHGLIPRGLKISSDDIREGLYAVINMFMVDPQFQGQTKEKLNNPPARSLVMSAVRTELEHFLNTYPTSSEAICNRVIQAAQARHASRAAAQSARKKSRPVRRLNLPGKLADCSSSEASEVELFIVEGDSAGGSAKQGRDRKFQAVLPLRGKVLNTEQAAADKIQKNGELANVVQALGCGISTALDLSKLRYHKVILLMDADSDGHHIASLMLTFFFRHMRPLIDAGHVFVAQPPLYRLQAGKETYWALDDVEKGRITRKLRARNRRMNIDVQRFKGLGEMMPQTLKETTLDPKRRHLIQIVVEHPDLAEQTVVELFGKDAAPRYRFVMDNARLAEGLDV